ncbi:MAG: choice-of-anchor J domain-containing protein [Saprospirales bacterium]|nr:choice-of-anchor J domain-containing protein [Saprospirales bacterium]
MKNLVLTPAFILAGIFYVQGQILLQEDFEAPSLPNGWSVQTLATDGGWKIGTASALSSQFYDRQQQFCSHGRDQRRRLQLRQKPGYLITPVSISGLTSVAMQFDLFYGANTYQGVTERATVEVSLDGVNWVELGEELPGHSGWEPHSISLNAYAGESNVQIAFHYDDEGGWLYGFAVDNVTVEVTPDLDAELTELKERAFGEENTPFPIGGQIFNSGGTTITSLEISYSIDGGPSISETFDNLNVESFGYYDFEISSPWLPDASGVFEVTAEITAVNGGADENPDNNSASFETEIFPKVTPPNLIDQFLLVDPVFTVVATGADQLDKPTDLDFFPILAKDELWVVNERTENTGGSTLTLYNASSETPDFLQRVDGNAWPFHVTANRYCV